MHELLLIGLLIFPPAVGLSNGKVYRLYLSIKKLNVCTGDVLMQD